MLFIYLHEIITSLAYSRYFYTIRALYRSMCAQLPHYAQPLSYDNHIAAMSAQ